MARAWFVGLLWCVVQSSASQNLVPNGSFEEYNYCPDYWNQLGGNVAGWEVCSPSPDFFHTCRDSSDFGVPSNWRGYQHAAHGEGYCGVGTFQWNAPTFREFICTELMEPLTTGVAVDLSMKVALGGFASYWLYSPKWTTRGIGLLLTTQPFSWSGGSSYPNTAHLYMDTVFTDTTNWIALSRSYVPDSAYRYVTLGNFFEDSLSAPTLMDTVFGNLNGAYVYIDEVCITPAGGGCVFPNAISDVSLSEWRIVSPFSDHLMVYLSSALEREIELILCDAGGRVVAMRRISAGSTLIDWAVHGLADGPYVVHATTTAKELEPLRVIHVSP